jgi:hypothetical protein
MAVKVVHVSDLSGRQADDDQFGRLVVREHPDFAQTPITLEVLPDEMGELPESETYVRVEYIPPGETSGQQITLSVAQFNRLSSSEDMNAVLMRAIAEEHQSRGTGEPAPRRRGGRPSGDGQPTRRGRGKTNYASLEHAGEPHRGRITEAEKQIVREHLDEVNQRLSQQGMRTIDPADPEMQKRYGLSAA